MTAFILLSLILAGNPLLDALRADDRAAIRSLLQTGSDPNVRDENGATALMYAAAFGSTESMRLLLARGANVNLANPYGATALMWATVDASKVQSLLERGADVNAETKDGLTALMSAAYRRNTRAMQLLIAKGADTGVAGAGATLLRIAYTSGSPEARRVLANAGVKPANIADLGPLPITDQLFDGIEPEMLKARLDLGADPNEQMPFVTAPFPVLAFAAFSGTVEPMADLLGRGANPNARPPRAWTPLMMAAGAGSLAGVRLLLDRGADVHIRDDAGRTALDWALMQGDSEIARILRDRGATAMAPPAASPQPIASPRSARGAVEAALARLQPIGPTFNQRSKCISCHHQSLPQIAVKIAAGRGAKVDPTLAAHPKDATLEMWNSVREKMMLGRCEMGGFVANVSYGLVALNEEGVAPSPAIDAVTTCLMAAQRTDGSWNIPDTRPPLSSIDPIVYTALIARGLKAYAPPGRRDDTNARIGRARQYLRGVQPVDTQGEVFKLLGLIWTQSPRGEIDRQARRVQALQRPDGGFSQLPTMSSDSYATGQALYALHVHGLRVSDSIYRKGADFLLRTQLEDGTWFVRSRAFGFQVFFETGFPHGRNQFISAAATAWAAIALALTL